MTRRRNYGVGEDTRIIVHEMTSAQGRPRHHFGITSGKQSAAFVLPSRAGVVLEEVLRKSGAKQNANRRD